MDPNNNRSRPQGMISLWEVIIIIIIIIIIPMEDHHCSKTVNGVPIFSGTLHQNIPERMNIISLEFDAIAYDSRQKNRFIPKHAAVNALKWYLAHCDELSLWGDYIGAITSAFPSLTTAS